MHEETRIATLAVFAVMAAAAALPALLPRLLLPGVVLELGLGALIGPQGLQLAHVGPVLQLLAGLGLSMLFLLAGFEVDPAVLRGRPLRNAALGWALSLGIALAAALALHLAGLIGAPALTALAMTTTAIGALLPMLRDDGGLAPPYGPMVLAAGAMGEAAPLIALSLILAGGAGALGQAFVLLAFAAGAAGAMVVAARTSEGRFAHLVARTMDSSGQLPLRLVLLVMVLLVVLSESLAIDLVLGAFVAGAIARAALPHSQHEALMKRLDGLAHGFLVPVFFIVSGMRLDLAGLAGSREALLMLPVFAAVMLAARGLPALLIYRRDLDPPQRRALALHSGTQLPLVVAITAIAVQGGRMEGWQAAAMVGGGILSMVLFPILARRGSGHRGAAGGSPGEATGPAGAGRAAGPASPCPAGDRPCPMSPATPTTWPTRSAPPA